MPRGQSTSRNAWDDSTERRLLLLIIADMDIAKDWKTIATKMGSSYTASACQQKFAKLKRAVESEFPDGGGSTPRKRSRPTASSKGSKGKADHGASEMDEEEDVIDDDEEEPLEKKPKFEDNVVVKKNFGAFPVDHEELYEF